jgi:acyl-CoA thioesterase 8
MMKSDEGCHRSSSSDSSRAFIEQQLELTALPHIGPEVYTNTHPLWHPPGARGIFGGIAIAQSLIAAQSTVPDAFNVHFMQCTFVFAGSSALPIIYHVEYIREGKSYITRAVKTMQGDRVICTATISFVRLRSGGEGLAHAEPIPVDVCIRNKDQDGTLNEESSKSAGPYMNISLGIVDNGSSPAAHRKRIRQWIKVRGKISPSGGCQAHLAALAYMADSYCISTIPHIHSIWNFVSPPLTEFHGRVEDRIWTSSIYSQI